MSSLSNLLKYVKENVSFYNDYIQNHLLQNESSELTQEIFRRLPIVSKQDIKSSYEYFLSKEILQYNIKDILSLNRDFNKEYQHNFPDFSVVVEYTSGSSGVPFASLKTTSERLLLGRNLWKLRNGISPARPNDCFYFIHTFKDNLYPFPFQEPKIEKDKIEKEINFLMKDKNSWWHINGYILNYYYNYLKENSITFKFNNLKVIENNGSYISDEEKKLYSNFFSCNVVNNYGSREVWGIAYDCSYGYLHVNEEFIILELIDDEGQIIEETGVVGSVVITSLKQEIMPFIRYRLNDNATYIEGRCLCGRKSKRINLIPDRNMIYGTDLYGNTVFKDIISYLSLQYKITNYHSISVLQTDINNFIVNIRGNKENKEFLENAFIDSVNFVLNKKEYKFSFSYNEKINSKSLFQLKINSCENSILR